MAADNKVLRVFWPSDSPKGNSEGTLVGWRNSPLDVFVVSVLQDVEVSCGLHIEDHADFKVATSSREWPPGPNPASQ